MCKMLQKSKEDYLKKFNPLPKAICGWMVEQLLVAHSFIKIATQPNKYTLCIKNKNAEADVYVLLHWNLPTPKHDHVEKSQEWMLSCMQWPY